MDEPDGLNFFQDTPVTAAAGASESSRGAAWFRAGVGYRCDAPDPLGRAWMADAVCRGVGAGEFFGPTAGGEHWCRRCPVLECCFWWAVVIEWDAGYGFGIWGGTSPAQREQVAAVTGAGYARARLVQALGKWAQHEGGAEAERRAG